jgi:hypothetical protein
LMSSDQFSYSIYKWKINANFFHEKKILAYI